MQRNLEVSKIELISLLPPRLKGSSRIAFPLQLLVIQLFFSLLPTLTAGNVKLDSDQADSLFAYFARRLIRTRDLQDTSEEGRFLGISSETFT